MILNPYAFTPASSYLLQENFEGTGYELSWTETSTPDEDYTTTVLAGSQSWFADATTKYAHANFTAQDDCWAYALYRFNGTPGANSIVFSLRNSSDAELCSFRHRSANTPQAGPGSPTAGSALSSGTTYHVWLHYIKGTGANATTELYISTTGTRPGSPTSVATNSTGTTQASRIRISGHSGGAIFDKIRVSATAIGDNPT